MTFFKFTLALAGLAIALLIVIVFSKTPAQDRDWKPDYLRLPEVQAEGDLYRINQIRDFRFAPNGDILQNRYLDREYDLTNLKSLWLGISHFTDYGIAHTFLSFEFTNQPPLVVSVEARMEQGESYSPVRGLMREYELIFLLTTEQDSIGSRLHPRAERVLFYPLDLSPQTQKNLFRALMQRVADLSAAPEFYNTLTDNCTSSLTAHATGLSWFQRWLDYRLLLPGFSDGLAQEEGLLPQDIPLEDLRARALLKPESAPLDDPGFSALIRMD
ncbi:DUF4105 domain-containing protein [Aestuariispira insulae]|nr:DUF4105 domain-containing protein [Aestuariispira insulae]